MRARGYKVLRTASEEVVEFDYRPGKCERDYRVVALRKDISVERGEAVLFSEYRYFFYITNDRALTADEVVGEARQRCNQENLIGQLKGGVRALHAPVNTLNANWAYHGRQSDPGHSARQPRPRNRTRQPLCACFRVSVGQEQPTGCRQRGRYATPTTEATVPRYGSGT